MSFTTVSMFGIAIGRILTGAILLTAGIAKLKIGTGHFSKAILGYNLVSERLAGILARWLPWVEMLVGGMLVAGFLSRMAAIVTTALLLLFSGAIALSLLRGRNNDCGCFGQFRVQPVQWRLIYRNLALMGILLAVYASEGGALSLDGWLGLRPDDRFETWPGLAGLATIWMTLLGATILLHLFGRGRIVEI